MRALGWFAERTGTLGMLGLLCLLVTLVIAPFGVHERLHEDHFRRDAVRTTGTVVSQHQSYSRGGGSLVTVDFTVNGHLHRFSEHASSQDVAGRREAVLYDPRDPAHAELADTSIGDSLEQWYLSFAFGGSFIVLTLLGIPVNALSRRRARRRRARHPALLPPSPHDPGASLFDEPRG